MVLDNKEALEFYNSYFAYIKELCIPLGRYLGIKHFSYIRTFSTTNHYILESTNNVHVAKYMQNILQAHYIKTNFVLRTAKYYIASIATSLDKEDPILQLFFEWDLCNGLAFYRINATNIDTWVFFGGANNDNTVLSYIKNIAVFERFIAYYERKIALFRNQQSVVYAKFLSFNSFLHGLDDFISESEAVNEFLSCIHADGYEVGSKNGFIRLTKREYECINYLAKGATLKSIAKKLQLSPKTIEAHVSNIKLKTGIHYKADLVDWFHEVKEV